MSELMYLLSTLDWRVRPIVYAVRHWAKQKQITKEGMQSKLTNFPLTCLVLIFLQRLPQPILPPLDDIIALARESDVRVTSDGIVCTFLRDPSLLNFKSENNGTLSELLMQFFEFLLNFDFASEALTLRSTKRMRKVAGNPMYIVNPFEIEHNVSKALTSNEMNLFKYETENAIKSLEKATKDTDSNWGILAFKV